MNTKKSRPSGTALKHAAHHKPLPIDKLRWHCTASCLKIQTSHEVEASRDIIGQERALRALHVGLAMKHFGYNIFVTGISGTGRTTTIKRLLHEFEQGHADLKDHCYVYNFQHPDQPMAVSLPAGQGKALKDDMERFVHDLLRDIPAIYEGQRFQSARKSILAHFQDRQKSVLQEFEKRVKERGFELVQVQVGNLTRPDIMPVVGEKTATLDDVEAMVQKGELTKDQFEALKDSQAALEKQMSSVFRELKNIERKVQDSIQELEERFVMPVVNDAIQVLKTTYDDKKVHGYLSDVCSHVRENLDRFRKPHQHGHQQNNQEEPEEDDFYEFQVNLLVDNSRTEHIPIVLETNPRYKNIFGTVERVLEKGGVWKTDYMQIKAGALLQADGGYLVLNALDALLEPGVWQDLKRTLRTGKVEIHTLEPLFGFSPTGMKPEAIELNVKLIMIGDSEIYSFLYSRDDDFKKIFKIRADFDYEMPRDNEAVQHYLRFIKMVVEDENLRHFNRQAMMELIEFGVRLSGRQKKISTRFNIIADVIREANFWAQTDKAKLIAQRHVKRAIDERIYRVRLVEDKIQELIHEGIIFIDTQGSVIGQVNGLAVYDLPEHSFGRPSRITAKTSLGRAGVINIEREAEISGPIHNKGVAILSGYLRSKFAQTKPLMMSASITFEQSYSGVDGDSASSTEIYAILSSLSECPLRQDIAVTGSINQNGEIQPIGGVNEKIEGFFDVCRSRTLTGTQGVMIPAQNVGDLMLRNDVIEAVKKKKFHIYAVSTIEEGIEILSGVRAGKQRTDGFFESGTLYERVDKKLTHYAEEWRKFERD